MTSEKISPSADEEALDQLSAHTGLHFSDARRREATAGLRRVQKRLQLSNPEQLVQRLRSDRQVFDAVMEEVTIGETYFFRDPAQLSAIREVVLPALLECRHEAPLRIWSAGCSTGEEAYSLAIILEEEGLSHRASILATDISAAALHRARCGEYGRWSMRGDPDGRLGPYFSQEGTKFVIAERLRNRVRFERLNLASDVYQSSACGTDRLDLVLCRNVLIYFSDSHVRAVARRLYDSLADGGWLVTGASDPPLWAHAPFTTVILPGAFLYRRLDGTKPGERELSTTSFRQKPALDKQPFEPASCPPPRAPSPTGTSKRENANNGAQNGGQTGAPADEKAWIGRIRKLSSGDIVRAQEAASEALSRHPLSIEIHYLRALLLVALDRHDEAVAMLRRLLYIDRSLAVVHLALGTLLQRRSDFRGARRCFDTARRLAAARPAGEEVPLAEGQCAARIAEGAKARIAQLRTSRVGRQ